MIHLKINDEHHLHSSWVKIKSRPGMRQILGYRSSGKNVFSIRAFESRYLKSRFGMGKYTLITLSNIQSINNHNPYREIQYER
jgi:hypothetical protein